LKRQNPLSFQRTRLCHFDERSEEKSYPSKQEGFSVAALIQDDTAPSHFNEPVSVISMNAVRRNLIAASMKVVQSLRALENVLAPMIHFHPPMVSFSSSTTPQLPYKGE